VRVALTIAGSDSSAGAGIQADLKTFAAHGVFGVSAITAVTAQNTTGVIASAAMPADLVTSQIEAVVSDIGVHAAKTGMLANAPSSRPSRPPSPISRFRSSSSIPSSPRRAAISCWMTKGSSR